MARKEIALDVKINGADDATEKIDALDSSVEGLRQSAKKTTDQMQGGFKAAKGGAEAAAKGVKGFSTSIGSLIKSLGIIALLAEAFLKLKDMLMENQTVADAFNTAMTAMEILFRKVINAAIELGTSIATTFENPRKAMSDFYDDIKTKVIDGFLWLGDVAGSVGKILKGVFTFDWATVGEGVGELGNKWEQVKETVSDTWDSIKDGVKGFVKDISEATKAAIAQADALVRLKNEVILLEAAQKKVQMTYQREAELQRQIRDDVRKTLDERIEANRRLGEILEEQIQEEEKIYAKRLQLAQFELSLDTNNIQKKADVLRAEGELADVRERIAGQRSEQLTNEAALQQELYDLQLQLRSAELSGREKEIEDLNQYYDELIDVARRAGGDLFKVESARNTAISELNDKFRQEDLAEEEAATKAKIALAEQERNARITAASETANAIGAIGDLVRQMAGENAAAAKALAIAELAINTGVAISNAIATASKASNVYEMIGGIAAGVAAVVSAIGQAESIINGADIPTGGTSNVASSVSVPSPSIAPVSTNTTELGNTQQADLAPLQAFVVETQLTGTQQNINQIQSQATFGFG